MSGKHLQQTSAVVCTLPASIWGPFISWPLSLAPTYKLKKKKKTRETPRSLLDGCLPLAKGACCRPPAALLRAHDSSRNKKKELLSSISRCHGDAPLKAPPDWAGPKKKKIFKLELRKFARGSEKGGNYFIKSFNIQQQKRSIGPISLSFGSLLCHFLSFFKTVFIKIPFHNFFDRIT